MTCSCSFHVSEGEFLAMLSSAATDAGRRVRILDKRGQSIDHPVLLSVPETAYLKCVICQVLENNVFAATGSPLHRGHPQRTVQGRSGRRASKFTCVWKLWGVL